MAFKQEHPGVWYDRAARGGEFFKVVWKDFAAPAKAVTANGVRHTISADQAAALVDPPLVTLRIAGSCEALQGNGAVCGRTLPCRYHS